jgi:hypothetical protein
MNHVEQSDSNGLFARECDVKKTKLLAESKRMNRVVRVMSMVLTVGDDDERKRG